jgi:hypothetical protein
MDPDNDNVHYWSTINPPPSGDSPQYYRDGFLRQLKLPPSSRGTSVIPRYRFGISSSCLNISNDDIVPRVKKRNHTWRCSRLLTLDSRLSTLVHLPERGGYRYHLDSLHWGILSCSQSSAPKQEGPKPTIQLNNLQHLIEAFDGVCVKLHRFVTTSLRYNIYIYIQDGYPKAPRSTVSETMV